MKILLLVLLVPSLASGAALAAPQSSGQKSGQKSAQKSAQDQSVQGDGHWANWRGPNGNGLAPNSNPPTEWSEEKNIRWKIDIPGLGSSSPIIFGDRIYVTTAIPTNKEGKAVAQSKVAGQKRQIAVGRDAEHTTKVELHVGRPKHLVVFTEENGVCKVDGSVRLHDDVIGGVKPLAFIPVCQHCDGTIVLRECHASPTRLARHQSALDVK